MKGLKMNKVPNRPQELTGSIGFKAEGFNSAKITRKGRAFKVEFHFIHKGVKSYCLAHKDYPSSIKDFIKSAYADALIGKKRRLQLT